MLRPPQPHVPPFALSLSLSFPSVLPSFLPICFPSVPLETLLQVPAGENTVAWWGEGSKRVSDCPLGDEEKERERGGGGRLIAPASNSTAGCHPWLGGGGSEVWGYRRRQLDATVPLDTANSAGSLPPVPGCSGSAEDLHKNVCMCECVNEPRCFIFFQEEH